MCYTRSTAAGYFREIALDAQTFFVGKGNFLDDFYSADPQEQKRLLDEPIDTTLVADDNRRYAAYFAAMVEHLAWCHKLPCPVWVQDETFRLPDPYFLYENWRFRAWQLVATPPAFKSRNIFGGDDMLSRV